ncbi:MAG: trypsin-like peptidase domain-containing protein [Lachnospiraceae bacterium]|nr:trypsin-like peptidase domain-containing protein [Lachnospiraceae bacterium]
MDDNMYTDYSTETSDSYIRRIDEEAMQREAHKEPKKRGFFAKLLSIMVFGIVFGLCAGGAYYAVNRFLPNDPAQKRDSTPAEMRQTSQETPSPTVKLVSSDKVEESDVSTITAVDVSPVVDNVMPAVVAINNYQESRITDFWSGRTTTEERLAGSGSGIIIGENDNELLIVTNNHVISGAKRVEIEFINGAKVEAVIKGTASSSDLAVVAVPFESLTDETAKAIRVARIGDSDSIKVGQMVIAIGNALGYGQSVTVGYVSALNREITIDTTTYHLIQTDAAINPGNSGGALLNSKGEVIAINSAKYSDYSVEGMGFAIPISNVREIIEELSTRSLVDESEKGFLGLATTRDVNASNAELLAVPQGVYVQSILKDSPVDAAGMVAGDVIVKIGNTNIKSIDDIRELMNYKRAGETVDIVVMRRTSNSSEVNYDELKLTVTLGSYEEAKKKYTD